MLRIVMHLKEGDLQADPRKPGHGREVRGSTDLLGHDLHTKDVAVECQRAAQIAYRNARVRNSYQVHPVLPRTSEELVCDPPSIYSKNLCGDVRCRFAGKKKRSVANIIKCSQ